MLLQRPASPFDPFDSNSKSDRDFGSDDSDSENDQWADAEEIPAEGGAPAINTHYPQGREPEEQFTDEQMKELLQEAAELKASGNAKFSKSDWQGAINDYTAAMNKVPPRKLSPPQLDKGKGKAAVSPFEEDEETVGQDDLLASSADPSPVEPTNPPLTAIEKECASARSVLNANIAACYFKEGNHPEVVKRCTEALLDDPDYVKALHRRAVSNEAIKTWTSLSDALKDYTRLRELVPASSPMRREVAKTLDRLPNEIEFAKKREMDEMIGKLKGLGNSVLGKFGLSTDNFKFTPNGEGGYSMNFVR